MTAGVAYTVETHLHKAPTRVSAQEKLEQIKHRRWQSVSALSGAIEHKNVPSLAEHLSHIVRRTYLFLSLDLAGRQRPRGDGRVACLVAPGSRIAPSAARHPTAARTRWWPALARGTLGIKSNGATGEKMAPQMENTIRAVRDKNTCEAPVRDQIQTEIEVEPPPKPRETCPRIDR